MINVFDRSAGIQNAGSSVSQRVGSVITAGFSASAAGVVLPGAPEQPRAKVRNPDKREIESVFFIR
jgi:hypothetical protein